jgi:hypothetical protein
MSTSQSSHGKSAFPRCSAKDGVLQAFRLMAEKQVRKILVTDDSDLVVGAFQLEQSGLQYVPSEAA